MTIQELAQILGVTTKELEKLKDDSDYGIEFKVYPNNQPSQILKYLAIKDFLN